MIHIFTSVVNRPDFVVLQNKLFEKFLKDDFQFHIVDDSIDSNITKQFKDICSKSGLQYYRKPERTTFMDPAQACADTVQWSYDNIIRNNHLNDIVFFCDSDLFLIDDFDIYDYVKDAVICGLPQYRGHVTYIWNGIMFFNMPEISKIDLDIDFSLGWVEGELTDVGGHTYYYFQKNNISMKETDAIYPTHFNDIELQNESVTRGYNFELHLNEKFLHYRAATNWHSDWRSNTDPLENKTRIFNEIIDSILAQ
jgi:hypothetical protein